MRCCCPDVDKNACSDAYKDACKKFKRRVALKPNTLRILLGELAGTFILVAFGEGAIAQSRLSNETKGRYLSVNWGWAVGVMMGTYVTMGVSGGHLNPAITLALAISGKLSRSLKIIHFYLIGQYLGAFLGALLVYLIYARSGNLLNFFCFLFVHPLSGKHFSLPFLPATPTSRS